MIYCINSNTNEKIEANPSLEKEIRTLVNDGYLRCPIPICGKPVIFKCGNIKIPHFAHKSECAYSDHEPESEEHLTGKIDISKMLSKLFPESKIEVEAWIPETNQEADVLVTHTSGSRLAFEFQCSKISGTRWKERHDLYKSANIKDFWILSSSIKKKSTAKGTEDEPRWLLCDLGVSIFNQQSRLKKLKHPWANDTDSNYVIFYNTSEQIFEILYGGYIEGRSLEFAEYETISAQDITIQENELSFPKFEKYLLDLIEAERIYLLQKKQEKEERLRREKERQEEEKEEKRRQEEYLRKQEWKIKQFEEERRNEEKLKPFLISEEELIKFSQEKEVKIYKTIKCPRCEANKITNGRLVLRVSDKGPLFGCTNYPKYCHYMDTVQNVFGLKFPYVLCRKCQKKMDLLKNSDSSFSWVCTGCRREIPVFLDINTKNDLTILTKKIEQKMNVRKEPVFAKQVSTDLHYDYKNIFQIWKNNGEQLPFKAILNSWKESEGKYIEVLKVDVKNWPYGTAYGLFYYGGKPTRTRIIDSAGCFRWRQLR